MEYIIPIIKMTEEPIGKNLLLEVGLSYAEGILPNIETNEYDRLAAALTDYLNDQNCFQECASLFKEILGHDDPVIRVKEIINMPNEPIPYSDEAKAADENPHNRKKTRTWGGYEDQRLIAGVYRYGLDNWPMVATFVGNGRTRAQCAQRWARGLNPRICKTHWSQAEDEQLKQLVQAYGEKAWTKIAAAFGNRSDVQCRYHYRQIVKGDELPGSFMSLRRGTPVALSAHSFFNQQFSTMIQPQVFIMPTIPLATPIPGVPAVQAATPQVVHTNASVPPQFIPLGTFPSAPLRGPSSLNISPNNSISPTVIPLQNSLASMRMSLNSLPTAAYVNLRGSSSNIQSPTPHAQQPSPITVHTPTQPTPAHTQQQPQPATKSQHFSNNNLQTKQTFTPTVLLPPPPQASKPIETKSEIDSFLDHFK